MVNNNKFLNRQCRARIECHHLRPYATHCAILSIQSFSLSTVADCGFGDDCSRYIRIESEYICMNSSRLGNTVSFAVETSRNIHFSLNKLLFNATSPQISTYFAKEKPDILGFFYHLAVKKNENKYVLHPEYSSIRRRYQLPLHDTPFRAQQLKYIATQYATNNVLHACTVQNELVFFVCTTQKSVRENAIKLWSIYLTRTATKMPTEH